MAFSDTARSWQGSLAAVASRLRQRVALNYTGDVGSASAQKQPRGQTVTWPTAKPWLRSLPPAPLMRIQGRATATTCITKG